MMWVRALATCLLLVCQVSGSLHGNVVHRIRRDDSIEAVMERYANAVMEDQVQRRQSSTTPQTNSTTWDAKTTAACMSSLMTLKGVATNPAGMAVCYNLPFLDNSTGLFQADLRLYMISAPSGSFAGIPAENVTVGLQYFGASVQTISPSELKESQLRKRQQMMPTLVQAYAFVGQINKNLMTPNMNASTLEGLLIPVVTLSAVNSAGATVNATLSSDQATFVNGVFADQANATSIAAAAAQANAAAALASAAAPFVLPGTKILIFPVGAIITGIWALLGIGTVAYGTVGRMGFREQYRRRMARAETGALARI